MLSSAEHDICLANKPQITNNCEYFLAIVGIFIFSSREKFILSRVEHEYSITSGPGYIRNAVLGSKTERIDEED